MEIKGIILIGCIHSTIAANSIAVFKDADGKSRFIRVGQQFDGYRIELIEKGGVYLKNDVETVFVRPHGSVETVNYMAETEDYQGSDQ